jgi:hypothetical protein
MNAWGILTALFGLAFLATTAYSFVLFDRLVEAEYVDHQEAWQADGRPYGFLFRPREVTWLRSTLAFYRVTLTWPLSTPAWARESTSLRPQFRRLRLSVLAGWALILLMGMSLAVAVG